MTTLHDTMAPPVFSPTGERDAPRMTIANRTRASVTTPGALSDRQRDRMYTIMCDHFLGIERATFDRDLAEKDWVVHMDDDLGELQGFTTLKLLRHREGDRTYLGFYSGDTVLAPEFLSDSQWLGTWSRFVFAEAARHPDARSYWVLLTATHRTYRIMTSSFKVAYPDPCRPGTDDERRLLDAFVRQKFPDEYDAAAGVVVPAHPTPYRHAEEVEAAGGGHNRYNQFFRERNPGYLRGNFLCCLTEIAPENTTPLGRRVLAANKDADDVAQ